MLLLNIHVCMQVCCAHVCTHMHIYIGLELEYETEEDGPLHSRTYTVTVRSAAALG